MKLKKGSAAAKAYMAKIRAKKGTAKKVAVKKTTAKKVGAIVLNEYEKQFIREELQEAKQGYTYRAKILRGQPILLKERNNTPIQKWYFEFDVAKKIAERLNKINATSKKTPAKKVGSTLKLHKKETRLGMPPKTKSKSGNGYHKDTKSHNVNISVVSGFNELTAKQKTLYNKLDSVYNKNGLFKIVSFETYIMQNIVIAEAKRKSTTDLYKIYEFVQNDY